MRLFPMVGTFDHGTTIFCSQNFRLWWDYFPVLELSTSGANNLGGGGKIYNTIGEISSKFTVVDSFRSLLVVY